MKFIFLPLFTLSKCERPNIILLLTDDMGIGDLSVNNQFGKISTPNIDALARGGVNFLDGHSGSSRCAPSRYTLMTGRYLFNSHQADVAKMDVGTPHLGTLFKRANYRTAIIGKTQPIPDLFEAVDLTPADKLEVQAKISQWTSKPVKERLTKFGEVARKMSFYKKSNYTMSIGAHTQGYDYAFASQYECCRVGGGYFENGVGIEPFNKYAIQQWYPEGRTKETKYCWEDALGQEFCTSGDTKGYTLAMVAKPFYDEPVIGPMLLANHPPSMLVQSSFDSRMVAQKLAKRALSFIERQADSTQPFFMYFGFRSGHHPFVTPPRYRGTTNVGVVGESIVEVDDIVGRIVQKLTDQGIRNNTMIVFMSDNGPVAFSWVRSRFDHFQAAVDFGGENVKLRGAKNEIYEAGHRVPFIWNYPNGFKPKVIEEETATYVDVYRTLADLIDEDVSCNEAPDSRSLMGVLNGSDSLDGPIVHHSVKQGLALRQQNWKWIPGTNELFDLKTDPIESNNLFSTSPHLASSLNTTLNDIVTTVNDREDRTQKGSIEFVC